MKHLFYLTFICVLFACNKTEAIQEKTVDVLVIGGSTSGTSAGIAAARLGASTLIVESSPWLGGMFSAQGVGACDGNHDLPSGIWNEFRTLLRTHYGSAQALSTGWVSHTQFEPHVGDSIFKAMASKEKSLTVLYNYYLVDIIKEGKLIKGAIFQNDNKEQIKVLAKVTIDATDIGESLKMAGADYRLGMDARSETGEPNAPEQANDIVQDLTWVAILKDYGKDADMTISKPTNYDPKNFEGCCKETVDKHAIDCERMLTYGKMPNNKYMINWPKKGNDVYLNVVEMSREERNIELEKAKEYTLEFVYYIQHELGFKHLGLADDEFDTSDKLAYAPYHREGRRLKGMAYLTYNHVVDPYSQAESLYKTGISVGDYPVDHHHEQNPNAPDIGFPPVPSFNIPLGSLIPETVDGLIVSDKSISVSNLINGSTRLQPVVLLTGQAAGTLAALAVKENKEIREVSVRGVQRVLLESNTYLMPLFDVPPTDEDFAVIQKIASTGILRTIGEPHNWANRTWFYPDTTITEKEFTEGLRSFAPEISISASTNKLSEKKAFAYIIQAGGKELLVDEPSNEPISKRKLAALLDTYLKPFDKEIDFKGAYIMEIK
ncbi:hypothetical protein AwDysgo_19970 [Bacteroidales bacterium]|nr:hypothetical protein AwDysgo_19970 [Bacteroidales bacterium]